MKKILIHSLATAAALMVVSSAAFASGSSTPIPNVPLPYTFVCIHCHLKITVKQPADWNKQCWVCACGAKVVDCQPKAKK